MNGFLLCYTQVPEDIQSKIENIRNVSVFKGIAEFHQVVIKDDQVEKLPFNMKVNIIAIYTLSAVRNMIQ